ncbi:SfnB family sulfur acquisition oxidoreductase [Paracoccus aestuariivivens]|uniref:SfnB family sulfur acquisition oxidoreductase n=1 Tax=Paracoccus aestuariivivens TaxID=1820333 RepID=A0A6L6JCX1_9RHOB|nr:SfnB family sulfur acquisition oxidoreductase [Paracoccus aestuariivivens]MTH78507.1 SfnB family sulfur acquisition oxidoreductase [Paracoccus aestuariivivens]
MTIHDPRSQPLTSPPVAPDRIETRAQALEAARHLAADWAPKAAERDRHRILPFDEIAAFTASGLGALTVPKAHGGPGLDYLTLAEVFEILCAADSSVGQIPQNHFGVLQLLSEAGSPQQKARWYAEVLAGARIGNAGPEKGRKALTHNTTGLSRGTDGDLRLNGRRFYSTGAIFAHWIPTRANDEQGRPVQVCVPHDAAGVEVIDDWSSFGQRTTASGTVVFDNVRIPPDQIIPVWQRAQVPGLAGPVSQLVQAAIDSGIAIGALDEAIAFVRDKSRPWVDSGVARAQDDPYIIAEIGRLQIDIWAARAVLHDAARLLNQIAASEITEESSARASVAVAEAKILTSEAALNTAEKLFELAGSSATRAAPNLGRIWRNARVHTLHDPLRWKYHLLGNWHLNDALPARHQWN